MCPRPDCDGKQQATLELNVVTALFHCFRCGWSGKIDDLGKVAKTTMVPEPVERGEVGPVPKSVYRVIQHRNLNPGYVIDRYQVGWDGARLCWYVSEDIWWRRAIYSWQEPKVIADSYLEGEKVTKGILGEHLLTKRGYIVITEGDYKAASIPLPFVGIAIGGDHATSEQLDIVAYYRPRLVIVALDGGINPGPTVRKLKAKDIQVTSIKLPLGLGPDDIPTKDLVDLLDRAYNKWADEMRKRR